MSPNAQELLAGKPLGTDVEVSFRQGLLPDSYDKYTGGRIFQTISTGRFRLAVRIPKTEGGVRAFEIDSTADIFTRR